MSVRIVHGDCRAIMQTLQEASVCAIVTDPPYELGFMGKGWDKSGVAFDPETWRQALRVLKPGGHLLAFGGTRTYHRLAAGIEDAGFEIRDQIGWVFGSGFPKSHNGPWGGTALKPAWEPICMARKPLIGTVAENWRAHGTGALNIDACRVPAEADDPNARKDKGAYGGYSGFDVAERAGDAAAWSAERGRWPANLIHDGSDEVLAVFPQTTTNATGAGGARKGSGGTVYAGFTKDADVGRVYGGSTGSAARFFYCAKADRADRNAGLDDRGPQFKRGRTPRDAQHVEAAKRGNHHPTVKPTDLMRYLCRLVTPPGGIVLDPFMGSGSTLKAAELEGFSAIGIELDAEYIAIARRRIASDAPLFAEVT